MKMNKFKCGATLAALLMVFGYQRSDAADPQVTTFTYQGHLPEGKPLLPDGLYSFDVLLFDAEKDGNLLAVSKPEQVSVVQGQFLLLISMPIDPCVLPGKLCWLQITVHPGGANVSDNFITVLPRQQITGWKDPVVHTK